MSECSEERVYGSIVGFVPVEDVLWLEGDREGGGWVLVCMLYGISGSEIFDALWYLGEGWGGGEGGGEGGWGGWSAVDIEV